MRASALTIFRALTIEAVQDGIRRRIVPVVVVVSILSLMLVDSCTSCAAGTVTVNGQETTLPEAGAWTGLVIYAVLALWTAVLAGVLGSDHLAESLEDGSAHLVLARPVGRASFALSRLAGALAIAYATGAALLGFTAFVLHARNGVAFGPAGLAAAAAAGGAFVTGALAMVASLHLPRIATALCVLLFVWAIASVNAFALAGSELGAVTLAIDRFGPPLLSAVVVALAPWIEPTKMNADGVALSLRMVVWMVASGALLAQAFRAREIR